MVSPWNVGRACFSDSISRFAIALPDTSGTLMPSASEYCAEVTQQSFRIHGGYGYSKEYEIERLYRDAPLLLVGEGTSEIQKLIVARGMLARYPL